MVAGETGMTLLVRLKLVLFTPTGEPVELGDFATRPYLLLMFLRHLA